MDVEVVIGGVIFVILFIVELFFNVAVVVFISKVIIGGIKRISTHNYFKNNIVSNTYIDDENGKSTKYQRIYNDVSKDDLAKFNIDDIDVLKDYFYDVFLDFESAYNNLDYNIMKILSTKRMYQNYYTGISLDLKRGNKRVIKDIEREKVIIFELDSTIAKQVASVMIEISYINYMMDKNGYISSGSRDDKVTERFEVVFRKDFNQKNEITKCPNCGAEVDGARCGFCRSRIKTVDFKIDSIKKIVND